MLIIAILYSREKTKRRFAYVLVFHRDLKKISEKSAKSHWLYYVHITSPIDLFIVWKMNCNTMNKSPCITNAFLYTSFLLQIELDITMSHFFEIFRATDQWGNVHVMSDSENYYLTFGGGGQQSGMQVNQPDRLLFQYTQSMMLAILFRPKASTALLLGLGAGSLAKSLLLYDENLLITAVELREKVKDIAHQWFELPDSERLTIKIEDAFKFISNANECTDLLFVDLYLDSGIQNSLSSKKFVRHCYNALNNNGTLVLNLWDEGKGYLPFDLEFLEETFTSQALMIVTDEGNIIVIIGKGFQADPHPRKLQSEAKKLGFRLDIPLQRLLNQLQVRL